MRAAIATVCVALALPCTAMAKTGLEWDTYPDTTAVGRPIPFTLHMYKPPPSAGGHAAAARGARPLLTFQSKSGRVVQIRAPKTDRFGEAKGSVAFPDKGPWTMTFHEKVDGVWIGDQDTQPFRVGVGLTQTTVAPAPAPAPADGGDVPWLWVLSLASLAAALIVLLMRRRGHWGPA